MPSDHTNYPTTFVVTLTEQEVLALMAAVARCRTMAPKMNAALITAMLDRADGAVEKLRAAFGR